MSDRDLLSLMLADLDKAPSLFQPTQFWRIGSKAIIAELQQQGFAHFRRLQSCLDYFVPTYGFPGWWEAPEGYRPLSDHVAAMKHADARLNKRLELLLKGEADAYADYRVFLSACGDGPLHIAAASESTVGDPLEQFTFGGARFSRSMLNYLLGICFLKRHVDTAGIRVVLEIGGGFGSLGELLACDPRNQVLYLDVDIPPTAAAATYYLREVLGRDRVAGYDTLHAERELRIDQLGKSYKSAVLCPWQLPSLQGSVDLFVNFISFQEMEPDVVRNYLSEVDRLGARYVLLRNLREGKQRARRPEDAGVKEPTLGQDYDRFLPRYQLVAQNVEPFGFKTVDGFHSELRLYRRA